MRSAIILSALAAIASGTPTATIGNGVTFNGMDRNGVEIFLGIQYGQDTGGSNRFKPPKAFTLAPNSVFQATSYGDACPQSVSSRTPVIAPVTVSENCLNLNVARPKGATEKDRLPVMVYIYGGGLWTGVTQAQVVAPDGLILESVSNGLPIVHVALNHRLGVFGFAQSDALKSENSENAGLRDQRLALEWVRDNIASFGGDPNKVTIFGQSSGGLSVGMQLLAYGGSKPFPFHQAVCQSQALEPGITGNYTFKAMTAVAQHANCSTDIHTPSSIECLRSLTTQQLFNSSLETYDDTSNFGDIWLPSVDGDFLPNAPSVLIKQSKYAQVTAMMGWCENDLARFIDPGVQTSKDTKKTVQDYARDMSPENVKQLLSLYPVSDFHANKAAGLSAEFYRSAQILRDILMVCQPMYFAQHLASTGNDVFLYDWNQTMLGPMLDSRGQPGRGVVHTSELGYVFGNISAYNTSGLPFNPTQSDYDLQDKASRSWSGFASTGQLSLPGHKTFEGFETAYKHDKTRIYVAGGPAEGLYATAGRKKSDAIKVQKLKERCAFLNRPDIIEQLKY